MLKSEKVNFKIHIHFNNNNYIILETICELKLNPTWRNTQIDYRIGKIPIYTLKWPRSFSNCILLFTQHIRMPSLMNVRCCVLCWSRWQTHRQADTKNVKKITPASDNEASSNKLPIAAGNLYESHTLPLIPPKGGSETLLRCFTNETNVLSIHLCYKVFLR